MKSSALTIPYEEWAFDEMSDSDKMLVKAAKQASDNSYAPYSEFHVGCAIQMEDGTIVTGSNQENASFPCGICAERTALAYAKSNHPNVPIANIAIAAETKGKFTPYPLPPCGLCRQSLLEAQGQQEAPIRLIMYGAQRCYTVQSVRLLLPFQFEKNALE